MFRKEDSNVDKTKMSKKQKMAYAHIRFSKLMAELVDELHPYLDVTHYSGGLDQVMQYELNHGQICNVFENIADPEDKDSYEIKDMGEVSLEDYNVAYTVLREEQ